MPMQSLPSATGQEKGYSTKTHTYYEPAKVKEARAKLMAHLAPHRPEKPFSGPVKLTVRWCYPVSETHPESTWKTSRPDTDNLQKIFKDCMTKLRFWRDDAQVCSETIEKFYWSVPGVYVQIMTAGDGFGIWE